jgi:hypothetical protein
MSNGIKIWSGASELDGSPIMLIATGLKKASLNNKTGSMIQTWILRSDMSPVEASNTGADKAICGTCRHMGVLFNGKRVGRSCYVTLWQAPRSVYASNLRGIYPPVSLYMSRALFAGRSVRLGSYGDPAAVPLAVWDSILPEAGALTGYTHAWKDCVEGYARYCMASVDSALEKLQAEAMGYRTFRVKAPDDARIAGEVVCPASHEAGQKTNCFACKACGGLTAKAKAGIVINAHGAGKRNIKGDRDSHA